jgi:hypothetical protein
MSLGREFVKINHLIVEPKQCCGSVTFWYGSGDPCFCLMDPDPNTFVIDLQDANKKVFLLFDGTFTSFFKDEGEGLFLLSYLVLAWRLPSRPKYSVPLPITACRYSTAAT